MRFLIDGNDINVKLDNKLTIKAILDKSLEEVSSRQRVIIGCEVNGQPFTGSEKKLANLLVEDVEKLNILTSPIKTIIINSLTSASSHLPQLIKGVEKSALLLQSEDISKGMELLQQVITGLGGFIEIVDKSTQVVSSALAPSLMEDLPVVEKRRDINQVLNRIVEHLNTGDFIEVSAILEKDLVSVMEEWIIFLPNIVSKIETSLN